MVVNNLKPKTMSALAKPLFNSSTCSTPNVLIPSERVLSVDKLDLPNNPTKQRRYVVVTIDPGNNSPREIKLLYNSGANDAANIVLRDASYAAIKALLTTTVV